MNTKTIFIHPVHIMIFSYINTITIMIYIMTPNKIMIPQQFFADMVISKKV